MKTCTSFQLILCSLLLGVSLASSAQSLIVRYPSLNADTYAKRDSYYFEMLHLASRKSGQDIQLRPENLPELREGRAIQHLLKGIIDIYWMATDKEREKLLLPIRIPIYKGLIGWRVALVHKNNLGVFKNLESIEEIRGLLGVQGHDWPDTEILLHNKFRTSRSVSWTGMFELVSLGRVDYFLRSVIEIHGELADRKKLNLALEPDLTFRYPLAFYLFVSPSRPDIAKVIEDGLNIAVQDGSFDKLFYRYYGYAIERSKLAKRRVIHLENPMLPELTPLHRSELWFSPN